nr:PREDICTED: facilitated trehalose transporter Tret1-like [Megachile rotundata]XP_012143272.1 PREDICTED: facilitated trehalose transporter Tret1-like [Megachile rotundata]XP_012143273.1 PREDICTED: facilitated trehalose transporter Tret1-like [Megachile rotundata]XP_012143274.1 PREDICTED: facilitated trehalose transporter Tret1-like [Megachile rotundata]XP_012143275.1 PREDICTED: facilitated trehalose transporter Tret1-like [Megachile rotundata]
MNEKSVGISQQTLVSNTGDENVPAKKLPQYIASLSSTLGALAVGMVLGWTNSAGDNGAEIQALYGIQISGTEFTWMGSLVTLGAGVMCTLIGILADFIGRKYAMLLMVVPFTIGWLLIIFANSVLMFYIGRFISGLGAGAFGVAAPIYSAETAENEIRGSLGSYFQLLLTVGILLSYISGSFVNIRELSIISAIVPFIFFAIFMFMPETPIYYLQKGNEDAARKSLIKLRGNQYNVENELQKQKEDLENNARMKTSFLVSLKSRSTVKSFIISYGLMFFQQLSGVNVVIFYVSTIFAKSGSDLSPSESSIIVGAIQVIAVFLSTLVVDRLGRKILLLLSAIFMCLTTCALGIYFYLQNNGEDVSAVSWLPLVAVCIFITVFSFGFGPIPWMMVGELFSPEVKGVAASSAALLNSILAFIVTKFYGDLKDAISEGPTFLLFALISAIGSFFVYFIVPETKGKSLIDIQIELSN